MIYRKINMELIVIEDEAEAVVEQLNAALDHLEVRHADLRRGDRNICYRAPRNAKEIGILTHYGCGLKRRLPPSRWQVKRS